MIIGELKYFYFDLTFSTPFKSSKDIYNKREGFILQVIDSRGNIGYGECSPLPGLSYESVEDVELQLKRLSSLLKDYNIGNNYQSIETFANNRNLYPSVKFGIEQCLLNLWVKNERNFISKKYGISKREVIVNAVFGMGNKLDIISGIEKKFDQGFTTFKIKIGNENFDDDYRLVEAVHKYFSGNINIRLDVNGKWKKNEAAENIERLSSFKIEYIEEPCERIENLIVLSNSSSIPVAVDESISSATDMLHIIRSSNIKFIVLKPMIVTGMFSTIKLIEEAEKYGKHIIISSSFESAVGKSALTLLASLTNHNYAQGLDTADQFRINVCEDNYAAANGKIMFDQSFYPPKFDLAFV